MRKNNDLRCHIVLELILILISSCSKESIESSSFLENYTFNGLEFHQSMASWKDLIVFTGIENSPKGAIYNVSSGEKLADLQFGHKGYAIPHFNVSCFGVESPDNESGIPYLYVSQWSCDSERGVIVYEIENQGEAYDAIFKQIIIPGSVSEDIIGKGQVDWVVDTDKLFLYALAYDLWDSSLIENNNCEKIVKFRLPSVSEGEEIILSDDDVIDYFTCEIF